MKKMLLLAAFAGVALTSCVNEEITNVEHAQVMKLDVPAMSKTRAKVKGEINGVHYDKGEDFKIFSKIYKGAFTGWSTSTGIKDYFSAAGDVATNEGNGSQYWSTATTYYWPDAEYSLAFAAYSPAVLTTAPENIEFTSNGLQITGFQTEADANEQYDLMYSDRVIDRNKKDNGSSAVPLVFRHALTSIIFSSEKEDENVGYTIKSATLTGSFIQKADFNQNIVENDNLTKGTAKWENPETATLANYEPDFGDDFQVTTTPTQFTQGKSALLLIPQDVPADAAVTIEYVKTSSGVDTDNTVTIKLSDFRQEGGHEITTWEMGKRYVYRVAFGQNKKIYFEPTTEDWVQVGTLIYEIQ